METFKLIVAGGRDFTDIGHMASELNTLCDDGGIYADKEIQIVSGMARGADALAYTLAKRNGIAVHEFPANWDMYGKRAGYMRNEAMGKFADGLLAFWDGQSRGTKHMIDFMRRQRKPIHVVSYR